MLETEIERGAALPAMENTLAVKLPVMDVPAKVCMTLKKLTGLSLGEIKGKAANDEFLYVCDYVDDDGLKRINKIEREMEKCGISVRQFEDGVEKPPELFENFEQLHDEIHRDFH